MDTLQNLLARALVVMNEIKERQNTATRIGSLFRDIIQYIQNALIGIVFKGSKANAAAIQSITGAQRGDTYRADDTGNFWTFDGTNWNDIGPIIPSSILDTVNQTVSNGINQINAASNIQDVYNVTVKVPLQTGFYTEQTARAAVPTPIRKKGLIITYSTAENVWVTEQFIASDILAWAIATNWVKIGGGEDIASRIFNIPQELNNPQISDRNQARSLVPQTQRGLGQILVYSTGASLPDLQSTNFTFTDGQAISGSNGGTSSVSNNTIVNIPIITGYSHINIRYIVTSGTSGGAFFDSSGVFISGFYFTTGTAGQRKDIQIPANAATLKTTYRRSDDLGGLPTFDYVLFFNQTVTKGEDVIEQFIGRNLLDWSNNSSWRNVGAGGGGSTGGAVLVKNGDTVGFQRDLSLDIFWRFRGGNIGIPNTTTGVFTTSPTNPGHQFIFMYELKKNTKYKISGFKNTWGASLPFFYLYPLFSENIPSVPATKSYGYNDLINGVIEFTTTDDAFVLGMYYKYITGTYTEFINDTIKLIEINEVNPVIGLTDSEGNILPFDVDDNNILQTEKQVNSSFSIVPLDVLTTNRDMIFKVNQAGTYNNVSNQLNAKLPAYRNGKRVGNRMKISRICRIIVRFKQKPISLKKSNRNRRKTHSGTGIFFIRLQL